MSKKENIDALNKELKGYLLSDKQDRADQVKAQIKLLGGKVETTSKKTKVETATVKKDK